MSNYELLGSHDEALSEEAVRKLIASAELTREAVIRRDGGDWELAGRLPELFEPVTGDPEPAPAPNRLPEPTSPGGEETSAQESAPRARVAWAWLLGPFALLVAGGYAAWWMLAPSAVDRFVWFAEGVRSQVAPTLEGSDRDEFLGTFRYDVRAVTSDQSVLTTHRATILFYDGATISEYAYEHRGGRWQCQQAKVADQESQKTEVRMGPSLASLKYAKWLLACETY